MSLFLCMVLEISKFPYETFSYSNNAWCFQNFLFFKGSSYNPFRLKADRNRGKQSKRAWERSVFHLPEAFQFCGPRSDINRASFCSGSPSSWVPPNDPGVTGEERRSPVQHAGGPVLTPAPQPAPHTTNQNRRRPCLHSWASHVLIKGHRDVTSQETPKVPSNWRR